MQYASNPHSTPNINESTRKYRRLMHNEIHSNKKNDEIHMRKSTACKTQSILSSSGLDLLLSMTKELH